ncbi:IS3 family transposase [Streptomyces sp. SP18BB07]|uniref:IS3 family transposase n=1 Tax=Streptomyces sp. SP18BB07 TaxID=3002522 RepID=UPI002E766AF4|nr:IS3 family transposase [Streptomyces sp. SP18BB07]MEE1757900.1 IS3 family transposase [Streptomyces sp. SP18BB07]
MNRFPFVADHQRRYDVQRLCTILGVVRSSFHYWRRTAADREARQAADARLPARIRAVHRESHGTCGVPRITAELREAGQRVNHKRIARVMREAGLSGVRLRRRHRTTVAGLAAAKAPDLIGRDFTASEPNTRYVGDITCLPLGDGKFLYPAIVIDLASRRRTSWAVADHMHTDLVTDALSAAERTRGSFARGGHGGHAHRPWGQYPSLAFADACRQAGVSQSMSAIGRRTRTGEREARLDAFRRYDT